MNGWGGVTKRVDQFSGFAGRGAFRAALSNLRSISLERHKADIAVRFGRPPDGDFLAKRVGQVAYGFYGTPSLCGDVENGAEPVFIGLDGERADLSDARWLAQKFPRARVAFRTNNQFAQASAAQAGTGLALLPHDIGRSRPALRPCRLERVLPDREIWLLTRRQDRGELSIRTATEYLTDVFARKRALFQA